MGILVGTCGWSYKDWVGPFYPQGTPAGDYLAAYARHFGVVEVDSTYYRSPARRMVQGWLDKTPEDFRFTVKMVGTVTHEKALADCDREVAEFLRGIEPLRPRLRAVLLQFGYFNRKAFATPADFFRRLDAFLTKLPGDLPVAVEIRNKNWLGDDYFELLGSHRASAALADHVWMPPLHQVLAEHDVMTGDMLYLRLIGDRKGIEEVSKTWDREVVNRDDALRRLVDALQRLQPAKDFDLVAFINNHFAGHAPETARKLLQLLGQQMQARRARPPRQSLFE